MENNSKIKWIVYCTTCTINKKIYIGVHKTDPNIFDGYIGDGCYINNASTYEQGKYRFHRAVKKYGPKNFIRNTISVFDNPDDAFALEADIITKEFLARPDVYNVALGGKAGGAITQRIACYLYAEDGTFIKEFESYLNASIELSRNLRTIQRAIKDKTKCAGYYLTNVKYNKLDITKMHNYEGQYKIPVFQYDELGNYECCYESIKEAARILNYNDTNIGKAIKLGIKYKNKYFSNVFDIYYSNAKSTQITSSEIHQYDLQGNYIKSYKNMQQAKNELNIKSNIYSAIKLNQIAGGYQWSFEKLEKLAPIQSKSGRARKVGKYDKGWNLIQEYSSLAACKKENGSGMIHVLNGRDEFAKGFRYKYLN